MIVSRWDRITWLRYHATVVFNPIVGKEIDRSNRGVKVTQISKWLKVLTLSLLTLVVAAIVAVTSLIDPNDYVADIEALAKQNQLNLDIQGDISWQFFPTLGISATNVVFSNNLISAGSVDELVVTASLLGLINTRFDLANLPIDSIEVLDARVRYIGPNALPIQFNNISVSIDNFSLKGEDTNIEASAEIFNGLPLSIEAIVAIQLNGQKISRIKATNIELKADQISISGKVDADLSNSQIIGKLSSPSINLRRQIKSIQLNLPIFTMPVMSNTAALTDVYFNSEFSINPRGYSNYTHQVVIDGQAFNVTIEADQSTGKMDALVTGNQFKLGDYLPPQGSPNTQLQTAAIFAPLSLPFLLWQGQSHIELAIEEIAMQTFSVRNLYAQLDGGNNLVQLSSLNADLFGGQFNATAEFDLRNAQPSFNLQPTVNAIDLGEAFLALTGNADISGQLSAQTNVSGNGSDIVTIQQSLLGMGQFSVTSPTFGPINVEQTVCQSVALLSGSGSTGTFSAGTQLDTLQGNLSFANGQLLVSDISTAIGNLKLSGRSTVQMIEQTFQLNAEAVVAGAKSSSSGCAINQRLQNQIIPFMCQGNFGPNGSKSPNCAPDQKVLGKLLQNTLFEKIGQEFMGISGGESAASGNAVKDSLKTFFKAKLNK